MERSTIFNGKIHYKWPFSIAMLNYQRVIFVVRWFSHEKTSTPAYTTGISQEKCVITQDKKSLQDLNSIQYGVSPSHIPYKHIPSNRAPSTPDRGEKNSAKEWNDRNDQFKTKEKWAMVHLKKRGLELKKLANVQVHQCASVHLLHCGLLSTDPHVARPGWHAMATG